jgi:hypothetical protein
VISAFPRRSRIERERKQREEEEDAGQNTKDNESRRDNTENVKIERKKSADPKNRGKKTKDSKCGDEYREDHTDVQMRIIDAIEGDYKHIEKPEQLAGLIIDKCSGVFFPEGREENDFLDILDVLAISIARLVSTKSLPTSTDHTLLLYALFCFYLFASTNILPDFVILPSGMFPIIGVVVQSGSSLR